MSDVYIIGLSMIRFNKYPDKDVRGMAHEVIYQSLEDAGLGKEALQAAFFANTFWGMFSNQHSIRGQVVLRSMGIAFYKGAGGIKVHGNRCHTGH